MFIFATLKTNKIRYYEKKLNLCFLKQKVRIFYK